MIMRKDYLEGRATYAEYYAQFVTPATVSIVSRRIGVSRILASKDPHFNDIPLSEWDALRESIKPIVLRALNKTEGRDNPPFYMSPSDTVCIAKEVAQALRNDYRRAT